MNGLGTVMALMATVQTLPVPLEPSGVWRIDFKDGACLLQRNFAVNAAVSLILRRTPTQQGAFIELSLPTKGSKASRFGTAQVRFDADQIETGYLSRDVEGGRRLTTLSLKPAGVTTMTRAGLLSVVLDRMPAVALPLSGLTGGLQALDSCNRQLLARWGIDLAEQDRIATPARALPSDRGSTAQASIARAMYPAGARRDGVQGSVDVALSITAEGKLTQCRVVRGSGDVRLDATACSNVAGTRYVPALDSGARPIASIMVTSINYSLAQKN